MKTLRSASITHDFHYAAKSTQLASSPAAQRRDVGSPGYVMRNRPHPSLNRSMTAASPSKVLVLKLPKHEWDIKISTWSDVNQMSRSFHDKLGKVFVYSPVSFGHLPLTFLCSEISGWVLHLSVALIQPSPRDERWVDTSSWYWHFVAL